MLALCVLDAHARALVERVDRQGAAAAVAAGVTTQPVEAVLTLRGLADKLVAQVDDVGLIGL